MMMQQLSMCAFMAKRKLKELFTDERGEVNIVAIVVLIGIAVLLALVFKEEVTGLLKSLFGTIKDSANDAVTSGGKKSE